MAHLKKKRVAKVLYIQVNTEKSVQVQDKERKIDKKSSQQESKVAKQSINELKYFQIYSQNQKE